ncbi:carboxylesterase/lipase family protein [Peribacillus sp. FSL M8-0224]|uniref:carboxylesterase/lipase family protein n=1 Tax=Peribacillus sp. FSL M8-0224 TaxID=2921568 RepID=UPI0030F72A7A|nr:carboxylesterase/lipase family protein [Brevibacterium sp. PAMC21349]
MIGSIVTTVKGHLQGTMENDICVWRGVRYAKAPIDGLRFRSPEPVDNWSGVMDAVDFGPVPPQPMDRAVRTGMSGNEKMDEDCLFLNIWSPRADDNKRPVMVWIPGGAYITGAGSLDMYNGHLLAKNGDVVVVSINYRLGALGYLDFTELAGEGEIFENNLGLRDQVASLKWVKENIEAFGGDPDNVTIFGESAGGNAVTTLLTVPSARGLFKQAIAESPAPTSVYGKGFARQFSERFLKILGIGKGEIHRLKTLPVQEIVAASHQLLQENSQEMPGSLAFGPVVDGDFLPDYPLDSIRSGRAGGIPLLIGTNRDEATLFDQMDPPLIPTNTAMIHKMFENTDPKAKERITNAYTNYPEKEAVLGIGRDATFHIPSVWYAEAYSRFEKTWMYRFDYKTAAMRISKLGATHGMEIPFAFQTFDSAFGKRIVSYGSRSAALKVSHRMQGHWVNFAKYGNPNPPEGEIWPKYDEINHYTMIFDKKDYIEKDPDRMIRLAWEGVGIYK